MSPGRWRLVLWCHQQAETSKSDRQAPAALAAYVLSFLIHVCQTWKEGTMTEWWRDVARDTTLPLWTQTDKADRSKAICRPTLTFSPARSRSWLWVEPARKENGRKHTAARMERKGCEVEEEVKWRWQTPVPINATHKCNIGFWASFITEIRRQINLNTTRSFHRRNYIWIPTRT